VNGSTLPSTTMDQVHLCSWFGSFWAGLIFLNRLTGRPWSIASLERAGRERYGSVRCLASTPNSKRLRCCCCDVSQCWGVRCPHSLSPSEPFCVRNWELLSCREKKRWGERNKSQFFVTYLGGNLQLSPLVDSWYCPPNCCPTTRLTLHYC
jgi:hypothetical protein